MDKFSLSLIEHEVSGTVIKQRVVDGYIDATALCRAAGSHWHHYIVLENSGRLVRTLIEKTGVSWNDLIQEVPVDGESHFWVDPHIAMNLAQWLSPNFALQVSEWVLEWKSGTSAFKAPSLPYHITRYMMNANRVPTGHFSVLQEMTFILIAPLELCGYQLPERMVPDISMGLFLCKHLKAQLGIDTDELPVYTHTYPDGRKVKAKAYPEEFLPEFRRVIREEWMPKHAERYFTERDVSAIPYLQKLMLLPSPKAEALPKA